MRRVMDNPAEARAMGARARERVLQQLNWERVADLVRERIRALAERTPVRFAPLEPLPLDGRRSMAFLHLPRWGSQATREVIASYARAFDASEDVTLVLWLDPAQGYSPAEVAGYVDAALAEAGVDAERIPDLLLVPDALDDHGIRRLHAAVDWLVPADLPPAAWRAAAAARSSSDRHRAA
jgi:hypothetical protein